MEAFKEIKSLVAELELDYNRHYITENMEAGSRYFKGLNKLSRLAKKAREELKESRDAIREKRAKINNAL